METHGIIIDKSISNKILFNSLKVLGTRDSSSNPWALYKIDFSNNPDELAKRLQASLVKSFYFHYYDKNKVVVVFPKKIFTMTHEKKTWQEMIAYGLSLGIPKDQLDLMPSDFNEETY